MTYRFTQGARICWQDTAYEITGRLPNGSVLLIALATGSVLEASEQSLLEALFGGNLHFGICQPASADGSVARVWAFATLADCSVPQRLTAHYRYWVIEPLLSLAAEERGRRVIAERVAEIRACLTEGNAPVMLFYGERNRQKISTPVSVASIYRWLSAYEQSGSDVRSLIPNWQERGRGRYLDEAADEIVDVVIDDLYLQRERRTIDDIYLETRLRVAEANVSDTEELLRVPSRSTIHNRIQQLDTLNTIRARQGRQRAKRVLTQYGEMEQPDSPLLRVEIDHTPADIILVDAEDGLPLGRPTLTSVLDIATRYPLGYYLGFDPPSYLATCEALGHAFKPKGDVRTRYGTAHEWIAYGLPRTLVVDNGREFRGQSLEDACLSLGIVLEYAPKRAPHFRGTIERLFRTQNTGLFHALDGTTFANIFDRGDYQSLELAKLTLGDIDNALHIFLLDYYAEQFHDGLHGIPARRWEQFLANGFQPRLPASVADVDILLGRVLTRSLFHYGVEIDGLRYNQRELAYLRDQLRPGEKVKVKYHPADISCIHIYNPFDRSYIRAPAVSENYAQGLSRWKHQLIRAFLRQERGRVDQEGLAWAKRKMRDIVAEAKVRQRRNRSRKRVARWETNGRSAQYLTNEAGPAAASEEAVEAEVLDLTEQVPAKLTDLRLQFTAEELEAEGWRVTSR
jgi:putative transposase